MKRSDMILKVIRPIIESHLVNVNLPENVESYMAFDIMDAIETVGMLPPNIVYAATGEYDSVKNFPGLDDYECDFAWEPEND